MKKNKFLISGLFLGMAISSNLAYASPCRAGLILTVKNNTNKIFVVTNSQACSCANDYPDTITNVFQNNSYFIGPSTQQGTIYIDDGGSCNIENTTVDLYFYDTSFSNTVGNWVVHYSYSESWITSGQTSTVSSNPNSGRSAVFTSTSDACISNKNNPCTGVLEIN